MEHCILQIVLDTPLDTSFDYRWNLREIEAGGATSQTEPQISSVPQIGQLALIPFGRQEVMGLIVGISDTTEVSANKLKDVLEVRTQLAPLPQAWLDLCRFAADYYQRPLGEVALPALPKNLRTSKVTSLERNLKKVAKDAAPQDTNPNPEPTLNAEQQLAVDAIASAQKFSRTCSTV